MCLCLSVLQRGSVRRLCLLPGHFGLVAPTGIVYRAIQYIHCTALINGNHEKTKGVCHKARYGIRYHTRCGIKRSPFEGSKSLSQHVVLCKEVPSLKILWLSTALVILRFFVSCSAVQHNSILQLPFPCLILSSTDLCFLS